MPRYRIHRIKDSQKEHFRWAAHTGGLSIVKPKDYEIGGEVESQSPYSLWKELQDESAPQTERPLSPGDLLETVVTDAAGALVIVKYIGFEPAQWFVPELKPVTTAGDESSSAAVPETEGALLP